MLRINELELFGLILTSNFTYLRTAEINIKIDKAIVKLEISQFNRLMK